MAPGVWKVMKPYQSSRAKHDCQQHCELGGPSIYIYMICMSYLDPKVCKYYLLSAIWIPRGRYLGL